MPKIGATKFIPDFIIPSCDQELYGNRLRWISRQSKIFEVFWKHKSGPKWTEDDVVVFEEWDKLKGHYEPDTKDYWIKSKQRFRSTLLKLCKDSYLEEIDSSKDVKKYRIIEGKVGQKKRDRKSSCTSTSSSECPSSPVMDNVMEVENIIYINVVVPDINRDILLSSGMDMETTPAVQDDEAIHYDCSEHLSMYSPAAVKKDDFNDISPRCIKEFDRNDTIVSEEDPFLSGNENKDLDYFKNLSAEGNYGIME